MTSLPGIQKILIGLFVLLIALTAVPALSGQTTLQAQLVTRPVTNEDIGNYKLPATTEVTGGLTTVGVGQPFYLEAQIDITVPATQIANVAWALTSKPANSKATFTESPLGSNVPIYEPSDRLSYQVAGRTLLRPDVAGAYSVSATVTTVGNGVASLSTTLTASTYLGIAACSKCHSNGAPGTPWSMVNSWSTTLHSQIFTASINGQGAIVNGVPYPYTSACWGCHTVGYDANDTAFNGGFYDIMTQLGWTAPTVLQAGNFAAMPAALQNVSNVQCENCHGPGSTHVAAGGDPLLISKSFTSGACSQCHAEAPHHVKSLEWSNSGHAIAPRDPSGAGQEACVGCHTANGFIGKISGVSTLQGFVGTGPVTVDTTYNAINCQTCHEPHGETIPSTNLHLVRTAASVTLKDGTVVAKAGLGTLCMNCHQSRQNAETYVTSTAGTAHYGPHHGPQADMLTGTNAVTYGKKIPSSAHGEVVPDTCVTCHMQTVASTDPSLGQVGGHTFKVSWAGNSTIKGEELVAACQTCHGPEVTTINFPLFDYNGDGVTEGVQTEVQHMLDKLSSMLPPVGLPKTSLTIDSTWTEPQLKAAYNWLFVTGDGSLGIHNTAYTVGLLQASIEDLEAGKHPRR
ncbi:MAG TPA: multiheme c-type cytochrome [Bryobacteraceae bacterium]|nr:multiheme c-type cytochrome [Bryobacteraceae bacterium]